MCVSVSLSAVCQYQWLGVDQSRQSVSLLCLCKNLVLYVYILSL